MSDLYFELGANQSQMFWCQTCQIHTTSTIAGTGLLRGQLDNTESGNGNGNGNGNGKRSSSLEIDRVYTIVRAQIRALSERINRVIF